MIIDCISDLHGFYPKLEGGDLLIVAGDLTNDSWDQVKRFKDWFIENANLYKKIVMIAGNHDNWIQNGLFFNRDEACWNNFGCCYLEDSGTTFEYDQECPHPASTNHVSIDILCSEKGKLKIWGSPWTLAFPGMNPHCKAFTVDTEEELAEKFALVPDDVDILVTHGPPHGVLDIVKDYHSGAMRCAGSRSLTNAIHRTQLLLHVFGRIHEAYGQERRFISATKYIGMVDANFINCSHVDENYKPVNKPIRVIL